MNKQVLSFISKVFLLSTIFSLAAPNIVVADNNATKFAGFYIGQPASDVLLNCQNNMKYFISHEQLTPNSFAVTCGTNMVPDNKEYKTLTKGKPDHIALLIIDDKLAGVHMFFINKHAYKKVLSDFVSSGIMEVAPEQKSSPVIKGVLYQNHKEKWYGWYYDFIDDATKTKVYVVHIETSEENEALDKAANMK